MLIIVYLNIKIIWCKWLMLFDFHYMKRIENIFHESATPLIIIQEGGCKSK